MPELEDNANSESSWSMNREGQKVIKTLTNAYNRVSVRINMLNEMVLYPQRFQGGKTWSSKEEKDVSELKDIHQDLQKKQDEVAGSISDLGMLFQRNFEAFRVLSEDTSSLEDMAKRIDEHLDSYTEKFAMLDEKESKTEEELIWEEEARKQFEELSAQRQKIQALIDESRLLHRDFCAEELKLTNELNNLASFSPPEFEEEGKIWPLSDIKKEMISTLDVLSQVQDSLTDILYNAAILFDSFCNKAAELSSMIKDQIANIGSKLELSSKILDSFPTPSVGIHP